MPNRCHLKPRSSDIHGPDPVVGYLFLINCLAPIRLLGRICYCGRNEIYTMCSWLFILRTENSVPCNGPAHSAGAAHRVEHSSSQINDDLAMSHDSFFLHQINTSRRCSIRQSDGHLIPLVSGGSFLHRKWYDRACSNLITIISQSIRKDSAAVDAFPGEHLQALIEPDRVRLAIRRYSGLSRISECIWSM